MINIKYKLDKINEFLNNINYGAYEVQPSWSLEDRAKRAVDLLTENYYRDTKLSSNEKSFINRLWSRLYFKDYIVD